MTKYEPYYPFIEEMLNNGIFCRSDIENKNILLVGRYTVEGMQVYVESVLKNWFLQNGAQTCLGYGIFPGADVDIIGDLDQMSRKLDTEKFDLVVLLEGLEKTKDLSASISALKVACKVGGILLVVARTPQIKGTSLKINYYEDYWRFDSDVLRNIFADFSALAVVSTDENYFTAVKFQKPEGYTEKNIVSEKVYSNRTGRAEKIGEYMYYQGGYFSGYRCLDLLGDNFRTDKCSYDHNYLDKYEFFLKKFKDEDIRLLELGIYGGSSLRMWEKYFLKAQIYGVDIMEQCKAYEDDRIHIVISDLSSEATLESLKDINPNIIIDDASHFWSHQIKALFKLFTCLPHGGVYIIEDMETSVNTDLYPEYKDFPISAYEVCSRIARVVAGKNNCDDSPYRDYINFIGMQTELISIMKGSCVLIKR